MKDSKARFNFQAEDKEEDIRLYMEDSVRGLLADLPASDRPLVNTDEMARIARWLVAGSKTSLLMIGQTGCGKTVLAKALGRTLAVRNLCPYFISMSKLTKVVLMDGQLPEYVYEDRILILDDLGIEPAEVQMYGNRYQLFNEILYARYSRHQPTVITTNLDWKALQNRYEGRVTSRIKEMFDTLIFKGGDLRR